MNTLNVKLSHSISQLYETLCQVGKSTFAELQRATNLKTRSPVWLYARSCTTTKYIRHVSAIPFITLLNNVLHRKFDLTKPDHRIKQANQRVRDKSCGRITAGTILPFPNRDARIVPSNKGTSGVSHWLPFHKAILAIDVSVKTPSRMIKISSASPF